MYTSKKSGKHVNLDFIIVFEQVIEAHGHFGNDLHNSPFYDSLALKVESCKASNL
jgi:hypothetical protein